MIFKRARYGLLPIIRIYRNGRLIWNYGVDWTGSLFVLFRGTALGQAQRPEDTEMYAATAGEGTGEPRSRSLAAGCGDSLEAIISAAAPRSAQTAPAAGETEFVWQAVGFSATYGLVFTFGQGQLTFFGYAYPHAGDTVHSGGRGILPSAQGNGSSDTAGTVSATGLGTVPMPEGVAHPGRDAPTALRMSASHTPASAALAATRWATWLDPVLSDTMLTVRMVRQAQSDGTTLRIY